MVTPKISMYQKLHVWLNKKLSLIAKKRRENRDYLAVESFVFSTAMDGIMLSCSLAYLFNPSVYTLILSLGCGSFIVKRAFPFVIQLISSINLIRVGK